MRKTNSKEVKQAIRSYILECLEILDNCTTDAERINSFIRQVERVGCDGILPNGNYRMLPFAQAVKDTIYGCYASFDFETCAICEEVAKWTDSNAEDFAEEKTEALFFNLIARETEALAKIYNVSMYNYYLKAR